MEQNPNSPPSEPQKSLIGFPNSSWPPSHLHNYHHHQHHQSSWPQEPPPSMFPNKDPSPSFNFKHEDIIEGDDDQDVVQEHQQQEVALGRQQRLLDKEPMFEKPLTPSDVGKLNRLVIPKQHAEKYFPLGGDSADKGLLLSFEDESGKSWRFRYSYWNSSQSYVLTKGWSRYVKEKQLDAGDVVLFERHRTDGDRLFIGWRRRSDSSSTSSSTTGMAVQGNSSGVWSRGLHYSSSSSGHQQQPYPSSSTTLQYGDGANIVAPTCVPYQPDCLHAGSVPQNQTAITTAGNSKRRLRLFGVNLECQLDESEPSTPDGSSMSSSEQGPTNQQNLYFQSAYSSDSHNQMDITFSKDVSQTRNRRG